MHFSHDYYGVSSTVCTVRIFVNACYHLEFEETPKNEEFVAKQSIDADLMQVPVSFASRGGCVFHTNSPFCL